MKMEHKFFVVINESKKDSWSDFLWSDIREQAVIVLNNSNLSNRFLLKLKKLHFSNKINKKVWLPFKSIWDSCNSLSESNFDSDDKNYIIFQSGVKFSPRFIKQIKKWYNCRIILYLPDTIEKLGIASNIKEFSKYREHYNIDYVFSFDEKDCDIYNLIYFDLYSSFTTNNKIQNNKELYYIGNCRTHSRLLDLHAVYRKCSNFIKCNFNIVGVQLDQEESLSGIRYNNPVPYLEVIENVCRCDYILELVNENQIGNTLRFKEAVCYGKRLLTNNKNVKKSKYYNEKYIQVFDTIDDIKEDWFMENSQVEYGYTGEFSPKYLLKKIIEIDSRQ